MTDDVTISLQAVNDRLDAIDVAVDTLITNTSYPQIATFAEIAARADTAAALDYNYLDSIKDQITHDVVNKLAQRIAERYEATRTEDAVEFLCDVLMELL